MSVRSVGIRARAVETVENKRQETGMGADTLKIIKDEEKESKVYNDTESTE